jgi:hypothetical protein
MNEYIRNIENEVTNELKKDFMKADEKAKIIIARLFITITKENNISQRSLSTERSFY